MSTLASPARDDRSPARRLVRSSSLAGRLRWAAPLAVVACLAGAVPASAATHTWTGGKNAGSWSNAANWSGGVPTTGEPGGTIVEFQGNTTSVMDFDDLIVDRIVLSGNQNTIGGSFGKSLFLAGGVLTNNLTSSGNDNALDPSLSLAIASGATVFVRSDAGVLVVGAKISGAATAGLTFTSSDDAAPPTNGTSITGNNTAFLGAMRVRGGILSLNSNGINTAVAGSTLGVVGPGRLRLAQSAEIADTTAVEVTNTGVLDMNGKTEAIGSLVVDGTGFSTSVDLTTGSLSVAGATRLSNGGFVDTGSAGQLTAGGGLTMSGGGVTGEDPHIGLVLGGDVTADSSSSINSGVVLNGSRTFTVTDGSGSFGLEIDGPVSDGTSAAKLTKTGSGTLILATLAARPNTYTGGTTILDGRVQGGSGSGSSGVIIPNGTLTIGDDTGAPGSASFQPRADTDLEAGVALVANRDGAFVNPFNAAMLIDRVTVNGGSIDVGAGSLVAVRTVKMTGGQVKGTGQLLVNDLAATSDAAGPATISANLLALAPSTQFAIAPGPQAPELRIDGSLTDGGDSFFTANVVKTGAGTVLEAGSSTDIFKALGEVQVDAGTWQLDGTAKRVIKVGEQGRLTGTGFASTISVDGVAQPAGTGLSAEQVSFGPTGRLRTTVTGTSAPKVLVEQQVAIDPAATVEITREPAIAARGTTVPLIVNASADPTRTTGQFANAAEGATLSLGGVPFAASYAPIGGAGAGDLVLTAQDLPPTPTPTPTPAPTQAPAVTPTPTPAPGSGPPLADRRAPAITLTALAKQRLSAKSTLAARLRSDEASSATITITVTSPGGKRPLRATSKVSLAAGKEQALAVAIPSAASKAVRKALRRGRKVRVTLSVVVKDAAGNASALATRTVTLKR